MTPYSPKFNIVSLFHTFYVPVYKRISILFAIVLQVENALGFAYK